jgi:hypothetical protein
MLLIVLTSQQGRSTAKQDTTRQRQALKQNYRAVELDCKIFVKLLGNRLCSCSGYAYMVERLEPMDYER